MLEHFWIQATVDDNEITDLHLYDIRYQVAFFVFYIGSYELAKFSPLVLLKPMTYAATVG